MAIITLPTTPGYTRSRFGLLTKTQRFQSPLDGSVQTRELPGAQWQFQANLPLMTRAQAAPWQAALLKLRGGVNRFYASDPDATTPQGTATGTPLVNGASQTGSSLITDGWTNSITGILKAGDYISFTNGDGNEELHQVVEDANSDGSGNATLTIEPQIRSSPANNASIRTSSARCEMALVDDEQAGWDGSESGHYSIGFTAIEIFT